MTRQYLVSLPSWVDITTKVNYTAECQQVEVVYSSGDYDISFLVTLQEPRQEFTEDTLEWIYRIIAAEYKAKEK